MVEKQEISIRYEGKRRLLALPHLGEANTLLLTDAVVELFPYDVYGTVAFSANGLAAGVNAAVIKKGG